MKKKWIKNGEFWNGSWITIGGRMIINPTEEQLRKGGYEEYQEPEKSDEELLEQARAAKLKEIETYDTSDAVNSFTVNGMAMWLSVEERQQIATQISANESAGREVMTKWFGGQPFTFPIATWKQMLAAVELYAGDALNVTEAHKAAVLALTTVADVEAYDITTGYPDKLAF